MCIVCPQNFTVDVPNTGSRPASTSSWCFVVKTVPFLNKDGYTCSFFLFNSYHFLKQFFFHIFACASLCVLPTHITTRQNKLNVHFFHWHQHHFEENVHLKCPVTTRRNVSSTIEVSEKLDLFILRWTEICLDARRMCE